MRNMLCLENVDETGVVMVTYGVYMVMAKEISMITYSRGNTLE